MKLKVVIKADTHKKGNSAIYANEVNGSNFKEVALILTDLKNFNLPIEKAIKEFNLSKSDWEAALGF